MSISPRTKPAERERGTRLAQVKDKAQLALHVVVTKGTWGENSRQLTYSLKETANGLLSSEESLGTGFRDLS